MKEKLKPGDQFSVVVGTKNSTLTVDDQGVLRFPKNKLYGWMCDNIKSYSGDPRDDGLNSMAVAYHQGKFTLDEYLEFYMNIGYSLSGFLELNMFQHLQIYVPKECGLHVD